MKGVIIVAGGTSKRIFELTTNFNDEQYRVKVCWSQDEFIAAYSEGAISSILLLYPDERRTIATIFESIVRSTDRHPSVIFVSSTPEDNNILRTLDYEADEFLIEPISTSAVVQIIDGLSVGRHDRSRVLSIGDLTLDRTSLTVTLRDARLRLQPIPVRILEFLMLHPGRVFTRQQIASGIWGTDGSIDERTIDVTIARIRDALKHKVTVDPIRTVRSAGYAFNEYFAQASSAPKKGRGVERLRSRRVID